MGLSGGSFLVIKESMVEEVGSFFRELKLEKEEELAIFYNRRFLFQKKKKKLCQYKRNED